MPRFAALAAALAAFPAAAEAAGPASLSIAAAANLKPALDGIASAFEIARPGARVAVTYGASGAFFAQLRSGAPFDVFLSADRNYPRRLVEAGLVDAAGEVVYAVGRLAVWTPPGRSLPLAERGLAALAAPSVRRVAIANPAIAPYGRAAEAALRGAGVYSELKEKLVFGESVSQAAQFAQTGAADAALLPLSLASAPGLRGGGIWPVPEALHPRLEQSGVVLRSARDPALARAFLSFMTGPEGGAVLARAGYALP